MEHLTNWAGNYQYTAPRLHYPETIEQIRELVTRGTRLKVLGTRHSFHGIADSPGDLISLKHLDRVVALDPERRTVTVEGGIRYGELCQHLHRAGYALPNMASLPHISVAGACATATHGSGVAHSNLATSVSALEMVTGDAEVVTLSREQHGDHFSGAVVNLGGLGVVTKLTLDIIPTFEMQQVVYENLSMAQVEAHFEEIVSSGYSVSLFTDWRGENFSQLWRKQRVTERASSQVEPTWFGATLATTQLHPLPGFPPEHCTPQMGIPGPWHERLPHFRMDHTPSSGAELQSEYLLPRHHAIAAFRAIASLGEQVAPHLQITEVRTVAADELWMSPCYHQPSVAIHFTWLPDWEAVSQLLPLLEAHLAPFEARPHWGKLFTTPPTQLAALFERLPDFQQLLRSYDPQGKFRNTFLDTYIYAAP
ncbi:MAG TPA: FAD-binding protein [Ardenticatenaceae bacterium]|jgi:xylitol oxidase